MQIFLCAKNKNVVMFRMFFCCQCTSQFGALNKRSQSERRLSFPGEIPENSI